MQFNTYVRISQQGILPLKITSYTQSYSSDVIERSWKTSENPPEWHSQKGETVVRFTILIEGNYIDNDGVQKIATFWYEYTNLDVFLHIKSLIENYDKKGKLVLTNRGHRPKVINPSNQTNNNQTLSTPNDKIEYINKASTR